MPKICRFEVVIRFVASKCLLQYYNRKIHVFIQLASTFNIWIKYWRNILLRWDSMYVVFALYNYMTNWCFHMYMRRTQFNTAFISLVHITVEVILNREKYWYGLLFIAVTSDTIHSIMKCLTVQKQVVSEVLTNNSITFSPRFGKYNK